MNELAFTPRLHIADQRLLRAEMKRRRREQRRICRLEPEADPENVLGTLMMLRLSPLERLRQSLAHGRVQAAQSPSKDFHP
jgi:hypothetical protein